MIGLILKYWRTLIDILLVVAVCIAFSYFDPFHLFRKAGLKQTANMVSSIQSIGQLVTAEYYGEVVASETEVLETARIDYAKMAEDFYNDLRDAVEGYAATADKKQDDIVSFPLVNEVRIRYPDYNLLAWYFAMNLSKDDSRINRWCANGKMEKLERHLLEMILKNNKPVDQSVFSGFEEFIKNKKQPGEKVAKPSEEIILIGRGSIKAGFNFGNLDERNFLYNKTTKQIKLYGLAVQVLDTIINPWFIPQLGVEGYTFISSPKTTDYQKVINVKNKCRVKLAQQALKAGIMEQAQQNGQEVLRNLFSVLLDEPNLTVSFNEMPYQSLLARIMANDTISASVALEIAQCIDRYKRLLQDALPNEKDDVEFELRIIVNNLKACINAADGRNFNPYALAFAQFANRLAELPDSAGMLFFNNQWLDSTAVYSRFILTLRDTLREVDLGRTSGYSTQFLKQNPWWYADTSTVFITDYNTALHVFARGHNQLKNASFYYPVFDFPVTRFDSLRLSELGVIDSTIARELKNLNNSYKGECEVIRKIETRNARYHQEIKPVKKFTKLIQDKTH